MYKASCYFSQEPNSFLEILYVLNIPKYWFLKTQNAKLT